jgi:hypothetical protein
MTMAVTGMAVEVISAGGDVDADGADSKAEPGVGSAVRMAQVGR